MKARSRRKKGRKRRRGQAKKEAQEQIPTTRKETNPEGEEEEEEQEEEEEEKEEEEEGGEEAIRRLDKRIAYVGGLLVERARTLVRLKELAETPGQALMHMKEEEEGAVAVMLGEDTLPSVVGRLRRRGSGGGEAEDSEGSRSPSSLWLKYLDQYLQQQQQHHHHHHQRAAMR